MNTRKAIIRRLPTGVPGFDEVLGGGLPEFSFNLIAGPPGCGKTTLAHQMMFALATPESPALYFTVLGEPPVKMLRYQQQFDFFDESRINQSIHFINLVEEATSGDLEAVLRRIVAEVQAHRPGLVFVDSFRSVALANKGDDAFISMQQFVQQFGMMMTCWQATTFLVGEYFEERDPSPVFTVADGLIWLRQSVERNSMVRKLEVVKMRGQANLPGLHTFRIDDSGLHIYTAPVFADSKRPTLDLDNRLSVGLAELDNMLGGGLPRGYSLLVAGPSGSGKSILAGAFLAEGTWLGETGVIAAFEQWPDSRGSGIADLVAVGQVSVVDTRLQALSVDEISQLLLQKIEQTGATRVVIDSLSGFELALAPTFRADFRESLARMVSALAMSGATVLMTCELEDRYDQLRFSPYGTAFLTDAIVVQRYIEVDSCLQRMMAVVKVRGSAHSKELRLFGIDNGGIRIGGALAGHEGLLGGRPTMRNGDGDDLTRSGGPPSRDDGSGG
jgi:circadian clock protein KaiC